MTLVSKMELQNVDKQSRIDIARKVGKLISIDKQSSDQDAAIGLAHLLAEDVSITVREALSHQLRNTKFLPADLIEKLANDVEKVSIPFVIASQAMDDKFLVEFLGKCNEAMQVAIANRKEISENLTYAICDVGALEAVSRLMDNDGATLNQDSAVRVTERFPQERSLLESMSRRADLPVEAVKLIIFKISREYSEYLSNKFALAADYSEYLVSLAERQVFLRALEDTSDFEAYNYFSQLNQGDGITSDMLFGFIQAGFVRVFIIALAARTEKTPKALRQALEFDSSKVIRKLLGKCDYSRSVIGAIVVAYERQNPKRV